MALDSRTKTMIVASITAAAMVVSSLVIWKQVFFGKRTAPEMAAVTQRPQQAESGALPSQTASPGQLSAPPGGAILAPVTPRQAPEAAAAAKNSEKTLDQIFSERQPITAQPPASQGASQSPASQGATQPPASQGATQPPAPQGAPQPPSGQDASMKPGQRTPVTTTAQTPAEPAQAEPQYRPVEVDSTAAAKTDLKPESAGNDPERAALESSLEKEALGLTKISKEKGKGKKSEPEDKAKKPESPAAATTATPETPAAKTEAKAQAGTAEAEPRTKPEHQKTKPSPGSSWKGQGVFQAASVSTSGDTTTVRIKTTAVPPTREVVTADSPARVIIDLPGHWEHDGPGEVTGAGIVRKVRIGKHPDKLRIVLDLTVDSTSKLSGKPVIEETGGGLTITVRK